MKKAYIAGGVVAIALCAMIMPRLLTKKQFTDPVADPIVEVEQPQTRDIRLTTALVGTVEPEDVIYIYPKAAGEVTAVSVKAGDVVNSGDLICEIDTKQVDSAKSSLDSATLMLKQAKEELARQEILYAGGGISQQAYESYQDQVTSAQTNYEISTMADTGSGLYPVKALLNENGQTSALSTGSNVKLYVTSEHADQVMTVPVNSVYYDDGISYVYTYDETSGTLHKIQVETGIYDASYIEVKSGLTGDEMVLTTWSSELYEGASARLKGAESSENQPAEPTVEPVTETAAQS